MKDERIQFTVSLPGRRPLLMNQVLGRHWTVRSPAVKAWKQAAAEAITEHGIRSGMTAARFTFRPAYPNARKILPDTANVYPTTKAIVDAIVDAGLLPDDNRFHNLVESQLAPVVDEDLSDPVVDVLMVPVAPVVGHGPGECTCRADFEAKQTAQLMAQLNKNK